MAEPSPAGAPRGQEGEAGIARAGGGLPPAASVSGALFPGRLGAWTNWVLAIVAASVLFSMMVVTFIDVFGRKLLTKPLYGGYEITEFMMGMLIFCALPLVTAREEHVTIDVFDHFIPATWVRWQQTIVTLVSATTLAYIGWRLWQLGIEHEKNREVTMTLHIPHGPFARVFAVMAGLAALACLVNFWGYLRGTRRRREVQQVT